MHESYIAHFSQNAKKKKVSLLPLGISPFSHKEHLILDKTVNVRWKVL